MMHPIRSAIRGLAALAAVGVLAACDNEIPTATGSDLFPGGIAPTTLVTEFTGSEFVLSEASYEGFGDPRLAPFLLVADGFDGELHANALARFRNIPDSVTYTVDGSTQRAEVENYVGARVLAQVDSLATFPKASTRFVLWELTQPWDSATVSWEYAVDRPGEQIPWTTPGGSKGTLLAEDFWFPGDTTQNDTLAFQLDSLTVARLRTEDHPGLLVTTDDEGARVKLSGLTFAGEARPSTDPDTTVQVRTMEGAQTFIYTPESLFNPDVLSTGGLRGDRSIFTVDLDQEVEACPAGGGVCTLVPLEEVTLNRAQLVFDPVPVGGGQRPLATPRVELRTVSEPELGRFAPLGAVVASDTVSPSAFLPGSDQEFTLDLTATLLRFLTLRENAEERGEEFDTRMSFALLTNYAVPDLGLLWFERSPRLRVVYTLPLNPNLP